MQWHSHCTLRANLSMKIFQVELLCRSGRKKDEMLHVGSEPYFYKSEYLVST